MRHYVHGPDGTKYGPADLPVLLQWVTEGRVTPETMLEPEVGGLPFPARDLPGLYPAQQAPPDNASSTVGYAPYPHQDQTSRVQANNFALATWILGGVGVFCCPVLFGLTAIYTATRAKALNHPLGGTLVAYAVICTIVGCGLGILSVMSSGLLSGLGR